VTGSYRSFPAAGAGRKYAFRSRHQADNKSVSLLKPP